MIFGYLAGAAALGTVAWLANGVRRIGAISRGQPIGDRSATAVLLVDLQSVFWDSDIYADTSKSAAKAKILEEIKTARSQGFPVVAVRQEWSIPSTKAIAHLMMKSQAVAGSAGTELAKPFADLVDHVVVKRVQDGFETGELDALFETLNVGELRIVGLDLNHCVQKTALAAQNRGFAVTVVKAGTLSAAPADRSEERLISQGVKLQ